MKKILMILALFLSFSMNLSWNEARADVAPRDPSMCRYNSVGDECRVSGKKGTCQEIDCKDDQAQVTPKEGICMVCKPNEKKK